ncbi:MAG TPA: TFIIB-type zinc ribbon-containing protein, partial [Nitrososphaeraceae archaeon]|nr:TFIIB-type zinc ribbon-containing protein [Nitrososphaeraceae archaeon]
MQSSITCSLCNSQDQTVTDPESGEIICRSCGHVISEKALETQAEWRAFTTDEVNDRSRTGMPTSLARHDKGLATIIGRANKDASGQVLDAAMRTTMERLRTWDFRTQAHTSTDRNLRQAFEHLDKLKDKLGLSDAIIEKTAYIYRKAQENGMVRGRTINSVLAASLYIACRELEVSRTLKDIAAISNIKRKELARMYRLMFFKLDVKIPMVDPLKCIAKISNKINLSEKTKRQAIIIMNDVTKKEISAGKDPMGIAATVLYLSCLKTDEYRSQIDIASAAGVTEVTIRNRFKDLKSRFDLN